MLKISQIAIRNVQKIIILFSVPIVLAFAPIFTFLFVSKRTIKVFHCKATILLIQGAIICPGALKY